MRAVHTVAEVRAAEEVVLARTAAGELMQRASFGLARTCAAVLTESRGRTYGAQVALLVGAGNNGGDTLFAGAMLARRGARVTAILAGIHAHQAGRRELDRAGGYFVSAADKDATEVLQSADLVVDGLLGIGGKGGLRDTMADLANVATECEAAVVAADLPSGVDADTGVVSGTSIWADVTVTFGALKPGLLVPPGADRVGLVELVDIGLTDTLVIPSITMLELADVAAHQPHPVPSDDKYSQGVVGVAAGSREYPGAAVLATGAALLAKPGLVRYCGSAARDVVIAWPSAIVSDSSPRSAGRVQSWVVGPGLGMDELARRTIHEVLASGLPAVVDADALTVLAEHPELLAVRPVTSTPTVLTPHDREFARLGPDLDVSSDRIGAVRALAARLECTVLLKGATTIVAGSDGQVRLNTTGTPWLATAGTGDVLSGMIGAYLASGLRAVDAASVAAFVHGIAGRRAADDAPCTSRDVVNAIPAAIRSLRNIA